MRVLKTPFTNEDVLGLKAGDEVKITGTMYIARDAAHKRMVEALARGEELPFNPEGNVIYYAGPAPSKPGQVINSVGPTSSYRMDPYSMKLMELGIKGMVGKGPRSDEYRNALVDTKSVYFVAIGGAAALIAETIKSQEVIAYEDLGAESVRKIEVVDFPCIVGYDALGNSVIR